MELFSLSGFVPFLSHGCIVLSLLMLVDVCADLDVFFVMNDVVVCMSMVVLLLVPRDIRRSIYPRQWIEGFPLLLYWYVAIREGPSVVAWRHLAQIPSDGNGENGG